MTEGFKLPDDSQKGPNCGVTAVAICSGLPFKEVWDKFAERHRGNWRGSTTFHERMRVMKELGIQVKEIEIKPQTLWKLVKSLDPDVMYQVTVTGHVVTILNNYVLDQNRMDHIDRSPWRRKRTKACLEIIKKEAVHD